MNNILELTLFPGRIRHIQFAPGTDGRVTKWNALPTKSGDWLNLRDIFSRTTDKYQTHLYRGESQNSEIKLSHLIYHDAVRKPWCSLKRWTHVSKNFIDDTEVEVQRHRMVGLDIGISHREFLRTATLDASLNVRRGTGAWNALPALNAYPAALGSRFCLTVRKNPPKRVMIKHSKR